MITTIALMIFLFLAFCLNTFVFFVLDTKLAKANGFSAYVMLMMLGVSLTIVLGLEPRG